MTRKRNQKGQFVSFEEEETVIFVGPRQEYCEPITDDMLVEVVYCLPAPRVLPLPAPTVEV